MNFQTQEKKKLSRSFEGYAFIKWIWYRLSVGHFKHFITQLMHNIYVDTIKIIKYLKIALTCYGSHRIHHQGALYSAWLKITRMSLLFYLITVGICRHNTDLINVNGHDRLILVIFSQALYKAPWWWIPCDLKYVGAILRLLWPCIMNVRWRERNQQDATNLMSEIEVW